MAIQGESMDGVQIGRRTHEIYIATPYGQPQTMTLYRADTITVGGTLVRAPRDDVPIMVSADAFAPQEFSCEFQGETVNFTGALLMTMIAAACDALDPKGQSPAPQEAE